ncbi:MAG: sulfatase-like hydrolase/transferase [Sandaracinaceae bacterium]
MRIRLPLHIAAGLLTAAVVVVMEAVRAGLDREAPEVSTSEFLLGVGHLFAAYLPVGFGAALLLASLGALVDATPLLRPFGARLRARRLFAHDPEGFAGGLGGLVALAVCAFASRTLFDLLVTRVHRMDLAAWAMGGLATAVLFVMVLAGSLVRLAALPAARRLGKVASIGTLVLVFLAAVVTVMFVFLRPAWADISHAYGAANVLLVPGALLLYPFALFGVRGLWARRGGLPHRAWWGTALCLTLVSGGFVSSGLSYGRSNRVRSVVEQRSIGGTTLIRRYARATDFDGDGHAWAFGGRDCDDFDPNVHPGALDEEGDGIDADCFRGDGSPNVEELGDGAYVAWPSDFPERPNILFVTIDALRPDHLGAFGYPRDTSPNIDAFAAEAVRFPNAVAVSSRSIRSIPAMMTGRYPSQIAYGPEYLYPALLPENDTVPELLRAAGYRTAVTMGTDYFHRTNGFFQGFDDVHELSAYKPGRREAVDHALTQLAELDDDGRPFFLWVHLFHVHERYLVPATPSRFGPARVDGYDTEIHHADREFQRLLDALDARGLDDETVVVLASDHGESFLDHGQWGHSTTLYQEEVVSTLLVRGPGLEPREVDCAVPLLDLAPTFLNAAGVVLPAPVPARSLGPWLTGDEQSCEPHASRHVFAELMPDGLFPYDVKSLRLGDTKLLWWVQEGRVQLFDLEADPLEQHDLSDDRREDAEEMLGLLQAWVAQSNRRENRTEDFIAAHRLSAPPEQMSHPLNIRYPGLFTVLGCDLPEVEVHPLETIDLTCYYEVHGETDLDLYFRVLLEPPRGTRIPRDFHAMHYPLHGRYRTHRWRSGEILADPMPMVVPPETQTPIDLRLTFAIHERGGGLRPFTQEGRRLRSATIDTIRVLPTPRVAPAPVAPPQTPAD